SLPSRHPRRAHPQTRQPEPGPPARSPLGPRAPRQQTAGFRSALAVRRARAEPETRSRFMGLRKAASRGIKSRQSCGRKPAGATPRPRWLPQVELLEARRLLSNIVWTNRGGTGSDTDNFAATYGTNATAARAIVDRAIDDWQKVIVDFNYQAFGGADQPVA